ncbi:helix-turn-helix domain-containing protein [Streptacidiphilus sp. P02-A3a]|nr:helix-turn-helix domain-containing protein [Streptacidiphilus sp. P02-A3a]
MSTAGAAWAVGGDRSKISRLECGRMGIKEEDLGRLLDLYGVDPATRARLLEEAEQANQEPWWRRPYADVMGAHLRTHHSLEDASDRIEVVEFFALPGLLQTAAYARALVAQYYNEAPAADVERRVELRLARQRRFQQARSTKKFWAVLDEGAILRWRGRPSIMRPQLQHLVELADDPRYALLLMPLNESRVPYLGPVTIFRFDDQRLAEVAYTESPSGAEFQTDPSSVEIHSKRFVQIARASYNREATRRHLEALVRNL